MRDLIISLICGSLAFAVYWLFARSIPYKALSYYYMSVSNEEYDPAHDMFEAHKAYLLDKSMVAAVAISSLLVACISYEYFKKSQIIGGFVLWIILMSPILLSSYKTIKIVLSADSDKG